MPRPILRDMKNLFIVAALIGCGGSTSPATSPSAAPTGSAAAHPAEAGAGIVGTPEDLRRHLTPDVAAKAPADDAASKHELAVDLHGVAAKVVWRTFADGANKYLLSVGLEVVKPAAGVSVEQLPAMNPTNAGSMEAVIERVPLKLRWSKTDVSGLRVGEISVEIRADGVGRTL